MEECRADMEQSKQSSPGENSQPSPSYESVEASPQENSEGDNSPDKIPEDVEGENEISDAGEQQPATIQEPHKEEVLGYSSKEELASNHSQTSSQYREKVKTLCEELQEIKKEIGYEEHKPKERSHKEFPKFEISVEAKRKKTHQNKLTKKQSPIDENKPLLRSIGRMGETIGREYRFVKRLPIDEEEPDWKLASQSIQNFEKEEKVLKKTSKKKPCSNCLKFLAQGITTDKCRKHLNKNHK